ncbi:toll/interleukin-1 receptor domain-containing protein [Sideroxydans sp.]
MSFYTKSEARAAATSAMTLQKSAGMTYSRILNEEKAAAKNTDTFDIFLSHSIRDAEIIAGVKRLLEKQGFKVYVDWVDDPQLDRSAVSKETAMVLRRRMRQSKSLIYVATESASSSKWMPWELGYFDGFKPENVAVLPILDNEGDPYPSQEYLALYPVVQKSTYSDGRSDVFVEDVGNKWSTLKNFGKGQPNWMQYTRN